jgi:hypothetical protein
MAEYLIYDRDYETVYFKMDIIEERPDGYFCEPEETTGKGWNHNAFLLLKVTGMEITGYLTDSIESRKRRYSLSVSANVLTQWRIDRVLVIPDVTFNLGSNVVDHS